MTEPDARARLTLRIKQRLATQGLSDKAAARTALAAVANFYEGQFDAYYYHVQAESVAMVAEVIPPVASHMLAAWQNLAGMIDAFALFGTQTRSDADDPGLDKEFQTQDYHATPPVGDFIDGMPDHYHVNGFNDSCANTECRYGHHQLCEVWDAPEWEHKPTLCLMTRVQCTHRPKHRYGQKCSNYLGPDGPFYPEDEVNTAFSQVLTGKKAPRLAVVPAQMTPLQTHAFAHTPACVDQGKHLSGDCDKPRPTCPHDPKHKYGEGCPK